MYYDPMISKLITWGKDRKTALDLLGKAIDEYVIRGLVHNLGFGQSILRNKAFAEGNYTTAFIPTYYPDGFKGDPLTVEDKTYLSIASHYVRNISKTHIRLEGHPAPKEDDTLYVVLKGSESDQDFKVERLSCGSYKITDIAAKKETTIKADNFNFEYGSLVRFDVDGKRRQIQFEETKEEVNFYYSVNGSHVEVHVYDPVQYRVKSHMAPPKKIDFAKSVLSPMPGSIVNVAVEVGQTVSDGQELFTIEAMKMQNIIKS